MKKKYFLSSQATFFSFLFLVLFNVCCTPPDVIVGPPYDRYDHNRTRELVVEIYSGESLKLILMDENYAPQGTAGLFKVQRQERNLPLDNLPAANILPVFTGVPLPLDNWAPPGNRSDLGDLIDFLATGRNAHAGVEPRSAQGDLTDTENQYKPILNFLSSKEQLTGNRAIILERLSKIRTEKARKVFDARYKGEAFANVLAFGYKDFWFVLYQVPENDYYSRLVVVPTIKQL